LVGTISQRNFLRTDVPKDSLVRPLLSSSVLVVDCLRARTAWFARLATCEDGCGDLGATTQEGRRSTVLTVADHITESWLQLKGANCSPGALPAPAGGMIGTPVQFASAERSSMVVFRSVDHAAFEYVCEPFFVCADDLPVEPRSRSPRPRGRR